ncbi:MAG: S1/P1 nuclease [Hyphomicrobiaceae bacterium]|nr:MAG: S1/P1 nuclease [Hyphomicrobiaceae bacterium]
MRSVLAAVLVMICTPSYGLAWGELGHRTVAEIAASFLTERAVAEVKDLLGGDLHAMTEVSVWADAIRAEERPETYYWHVVEIPSDGVRYDRARDCKNGDCIVEKIAEIAQVLGDHSVARPQRTEALQFLIHLVGDLHMPLHAFAPLNHPAGAWVRIGDTTDKLHYWWDDEFVDALGFDSLELGKQLAADTTVAEHREWAKGTSEDWANESFQITHVFVTKHGLLDVNWGDFSEDRPLTLPTSVIEEVKPIVVQRLKMAGVRLAWLLNEAFK